MSVTWYRQSRSRHIRLRARSPPVAWRSEATGVIMLVHLLTVVRYLSRISCGSSGRHGTSASGAEPTDVSGSVTSQT